MWLMSSLVYARTSPNILMRRVAPCQKVERTVRRSHRFGTLAVERLLESVENFFSDFSDLDLLRFDGGSAVAWASLLS